MIDKVHRSAAQSGLNRRHALLTITFACVPSASGSKLLVNPNLKVADGGSFYEHPDKFVHANLSDLGREFLFAGERLVSGISPASNPYAPPGSISLPSRDAHNSIIRNLNLHADVNFKALPPAKKPSGTAFFPGGPVSNIYARIFMGRGSGSPLFQATGHDGILPVMFDMDGPLKTGKRVEYADNTGSRPDWGLIVNSKKYEQPPEFLLISSIPNPYEPACRLVFVAGRHGAGARAIDLVLSDERTLSYLYQKTRRFVGWQALIEVPNVQGNWPSAPLGEMIVFEIHADFDRLAQILDGKPFFGHPYLEGLSDTMGLAKLVDPEGFFAEDIGQYQALDSKRGVLGTIAEDSPIARDNADSSRASVWPGEIGRTAAAPKQEQVLQKPDLFELFLSIHRGQKSASLNPADCLSLQQQASRLINGDFNMPFKDSNFAISGEEKKSIRLAVLRCLSES